MALDFQGNLVSIIQVIALVMLVIGVYPYRIRTKNRNLIMHGFFSIAAIGLNLATTLSIMIPVFTGNFMLISNLSLVQLSIVWLHAIFGIVTIAPSFKRTRMFKNVETNDTHFHNLDIYISSGISHIRLQHNMILWFDIIVK
jgi:hypothetical protein